MKRTRYWLFKSEPSTFSIDDLAKRAKQTEHWDGVRNFQVRNLLRDEIQIGDKAFFYHSSCMPPGIVGTMRIVKNGYPDFTAWDLKSEHFDQGGSPEKPRWYMVDVKLEKKFKKIIPLDELRQHSQLKEMTILKKGNRLSITPITDKEWDYIISNLAKI
jgi:predicted RNA-binding protein with PUA-like domain